MKFVAEIQWLVHESAVIVEYSSMNFEWTYASVQKYIAIGFQRCFAEFVRLFVEYEIFVLQSLQHCFGSRIMFFTVFDAWII